jgi:soluble lytic murein transglycosylase
VNFLFSLMIGIVLGMSFEANGEAFATWEKALSHPSLQLTRSDLITHEKMLQTYKIADKGYASHYILEKGIRETQGKPRFKIYFDWLSDLRSYPGLGLAELMRSCHELKTKLREVRGLSFLLTVQRLHSCRQIVLQQLAPKVLADAAIQSTELEFLSSFMYALVYGKSQPDFIWFLQRLAARPEAAALVSDRVTKYVVRTNRQVPRDILAHLVITPELTRHVQTYGLDAKATKQIFQQEYSRLIEEAYASIEKKPKDETSKLITALGKWLKLNIHRLDPETAWGRYGDLGKNLWRNGHTELAASIFEQVMAQPYPELRDDARFFRLWIWAARKEWKQARHWIENERLPSAFDQLTDSRLKFWIATVYHETGAPTEARKFWERLILKHPLSFYGIMATKSLKAHQPQSALTNFYQDNSKAKPPSFDTGTLGEEVGHTLQRLRAWSRLDAKVFLAAEARAWRRHARAVSEQSVAKLRSTLESDLNILAAAIVGNEENYLESFRMLYRVIDTQRAQYGRALLEVLYPRPFFKQLSTAMKSSPIDPLVVLSLIRQESVFNPEARSRVGALGLMQLMPNTAKRYRRGVSPKQLYAPATNLELGIKYFQQLHKRYAGNYVFILSAYNAGESRVERWKSNYLANEDMLTNIENIPFLETRNYVKLIFRNLFFYKTMTDDPQITDTATLNRIHDVPLGFKR